MAIDAERATARSCCDATLVSRDRLDVGVLVVAGGGGGDDDDEEKQELDALMNRLLCSSADSS